MRFNIDFDDVEQYQVKWLKVFDCVRGLKFKSCICHLYVILIVYYFNNNMLEHDE